MKTLFDDNEHFNDVAHQIDREAAQALRPIYEKWAKAGYRRREISYIIAGANTCEELAGLLWGDNDEQS